MHPDWVPNKLMGYGSEKVVASSIERFNRAKHRSEAIETVQSASSSVDVSTTSFEDDSESDMSFTETNDEENISVLAINEVEKISISVQTDLTMEHIDQMSDVINTQTVEIINLKEKLNSIVITEDSFKDSKKTKFYTGLENFQILMILFNLIAPDLNETSQSSLTKFQQFILTLQRLRLNLNLTDLAYRYGVCTNTASKIFQNCLYIMWKKLKRSIAWPERESLWKTMPSSFLDTFGKKVSVIIDCFELKTEKPSNLQSSAQLWSHYKHHHTTKFLIGICPQGSITFISSGHSGKTSDKEITLKSGILNKLLPGDLVLADRGFLITDEVELQCAEVKMPCFTRGKNQLEPWDIEQNRKISHLRIHVERVIGSLRQKYEILHSVVPIRLLQTHSFEDAPSLVNQIAIVCCALINMCPTVVPLD